MVAGMDGDPFAEDAIREARRRRKELETEAPRVEGDVRALAELQSRGWTLGDGDDLDAIGDHIAKVVEVYRPLEFGSKLHDLIHEARGAVRAERNRRNLEHYRAVQRQRDRIQKVLVAANRISEAAELLDLVDGIEDRRAELFPHQPVGAIDASGMGDTELTAAIQTNERLADLSEASSNQWTRGAELLSMVKDARFRRHAKTAQAMAAECAEDAAGYRARAEAARGELESRKVVDDMDADALRKRVAELERIIADSGGK